MGERWGKPSTNPRTPEKSNFLSVLLLPAKLQNSGYFTCVLISLTRPIGHADCLAHKELETLVISEFGDPYARCCLPVQSKVCIPSLHRNACHPAPHSRNP
jgi:hypothetical protein